MCVPATVHPATVDIPKVFSFLNNLKQQQTEIANQLKYLLDVAVSWSKRCSKTKDILSIIEKSLQETVV